MRQSIAAVTSGLLLGLGLTVSGMVNPAKVTGFLDLAGDWDPSLALVLAGATGVTGLTFGLIMRRRRPVFAARFFAPGDDGIDARLIGGAALFGIGWGMVGLCPGPAFTTLLLGRWEAYVFFGAMVAGMAAFRLWSVRAGSRRGAAAPVLDDA